jgi:DNA topoisomerase-3
MSKALIIAEKPSVARDIIAALGGFAASPHTTQGISVWESADYVCSHALGHLLELYEPEDYDPKLKQWRLQDLPVKPSSFLLKPKSQTAQILRVLRQILARPDVTEVINACDAAREGELIFREIIQFSLCDKPTTRVWLQSMTHDAIRSAFTARKPATFFNGLANAAHGRSQADWLIGMNLSRAATLKLSRASEGGVWSIGRVQTPTLAMLVDREFQILAHDPRPYHLVKARFKAEDHEYEGTWFDPNFAAAPQDPQGKPERIFDAAKAQSITAALKPGTPCQASETRKSREQHAPALYSLTALQRHMAGRFKWSAKRTLDVAQKCYESHKVITYPRTESEALPGDYEENIKKILATLTTIPAYASVTKSLCNDTWHNRDRVFNDSAVSDHFAIIPTGHFPSSLPEDEGLLFDAVIRRLMASLMPPAVIDQIERITAVDGATFRSGPEEFTRIPGWQVATMDQSSQRRKTELFLKPITKDSSIHLLSTETVAEQTKPPPRIGEAQLLSLMEHAGRQLDDAEMARLLREHGGLGTAATRAEIIENLKQKSYVFHNLQPTVKGLHLIRFLKLARAENLTSPLLTAELEKHLHRVEEAASTRDSFICETIKSVEASLRALANFDLERAFDHAPALGPCPRCESSVHERMWNYSCLSHRLNDNPCGFILTKDCDGRWLDPPTVSRLLASDADGILLDGFPDSDHSMTRRRRIKINHGVLEILSEAGLTLDRPLHVNETKSSARRRVTWGPCPVHTSDGCLIVETKNAFICESKLRALREGHTEAPGFQLPKSICSQKLKFEDINAFIKQGKTRKIEGFKSKGGKVFNASVVRNAAGSWTFEFR